MSARSFIMASPTPCSTIRTPARHTSTVSASTQFCETVPISLITRSANSDSLSCPAKIILKICERRLDNNDTEVRVEVSRADDPRFVFADGISRQKYAVLRDNYNLTIDFESFARSIIGRVRERDSPTDPLRINCKVDEDRNMCTLELVTVLKLQTTRIPIELKRVVGEELNNHLIAALDRLKKEFDKLAKAYKETERRLNDEKEQRHVLQEKHDDLLDQKEREVAAFKQELKDAEGRITQLDSELKSEREEKAIANVALDDLRQDLNALEEEKTTAETDVDVLAAELTELEAQLTDARERAADAEHAVDDERERRERAERLLAEERAKRERIENDLVKAREIIRKTIKAEDRRQSSVSFDMQKVEELRGELADRDEQLRRLAENDVLLKERCEKLNERCEKLNVEVVVLRDQNEQFRLREEARKQAVERFTAASRLPILPTTSTPPQQALTPLTYPMSSALRTTVGTAPPTAFLGASPLSYTNVIGRSYTPGALRPSIQVSTPLRNSPQQQLLNAYKQPALGAAKENTPPLQQTRPGVTHKKQE